MVRMDMLLAMRIYQRVVERGKITDAARDLGMSQSNVSDRLRRLEERVGAPLFYRNNSSFTLTDIGQEFYDQSLRTLHLAALAQEVPAVFASGPLRGTLRVAAPYCIGDLVLPQTLNLFRQLHAELICEIILSDSNAAQIAERPDIAIQFGDTQQNGYIATSLGAVQQVLVASPDYIAANGAPATPLDIGGYPFVKIDGTFPGNRVSFTDAGVIIEADINPAWTVGNWRPMHTLLVEGEGIGIAHQPTIADALSNGTLRRLLPTYPLPSIPVNLLYPREDVTTEKISKAVRFIRQEMYRRWAL